MKFESAVEELQYWMQRLQLELHSKTAVRHIVALERLCEMFADKVRRDKWAPPSELPRRMKLSTDWLALQREAQKVTRQPGERRVGALRVLQGGMSSRAKR
jgi:hypothetical protein